MLVVTCAGTLLLGGFRRGTHRQGGESSAGVSSSPLVVLLMINLILLFAGMLLDAISIFYVFLPILMPIIAHFGWDPVWFGVVMTINLAIGQVTPRGGEPLRGSQHQRPHHGGTHASGPSAHRGLRPGPGGGVPDPLLEHWLPSYWGSTGRPDPFRNSRTPDRNVGRSAPFARSSPRLCRKKERRSCGDSFGKSLRVYACSTSGASSFRAFSRSSTWSRPSVP
jgi:hypothetical protein